MSRYPDPPLAGVRVVDLTTFLSGPFCTQILADLGADVIKVEPLHGDASRHIPPHFVDGDSAYYLAHNRGKRSIALDLKSPAGQSIARDLVRRSDVVVENFRPGVSERLGLSATDLCAERPALIWASISGFGQSGPLRDQPAFDIVVQALSGVMSLTGVPDAPAMRLGVPAGDLVAGMYGVMAILAALAARHRTGVGRIADISMLDGQLSMLSYQALYASVGRITPKPQGNRHDSIPTYRSFVAGDGRQLVVAANTQRMWVDLCAVLGLDRLLDDPHFAGAGDRLRHQHDLSSVLEGAFLGNPAHYWVARLVERGVPAALIRTVPEALEDARAARRAMVVPLRSATGQVVQTVGSPIKYVGEPAPPSRYPPGLGADTVEILAELGWSPPRIGELREQGVLIADRAPTSTTPPADGY
jgi:crotonobetainyl-CoA:carnitine CoA-transferase CaiB-like acyl-CoA transferase